MKKFILLLFTLPLLFLTYAPASAQEDDPVTQCADGVALFLAGDPNAAYPLLEAGFNARDTVTFPDSNNLGICGIALGLLRDNAGDRVGALEAYSVSLEIFRQTGQQQLEGIVLNNIAVVYRVQGQYEAALTTYEEALTIHRELSDRAGEGTTLNNIGLVYQSQGRYEAALTTYEEALAIRREVGDRAGEGTTLNNIAAAYQLQGWYEAALTTFEEALVIRRELDDRAGEGTTLNNIALVYLAQGQYEAALTTFEEALVIVREVDGRPGEGKTLNNIGLVYRSQGRYEAALTIYEEALTIHREVGDRAGEGTTLNNIGLVYQSQGRYEAALSTYETALAVLREVGDRAGEGLTLNNIAAVYQLQGQYEAALSTYETALAIRREVGDRAGEGATLSNIGLVYQTQGQYEEAMARYEVALAISREVGDRAGEGTTLNNIAVVYDSQGRHEEALATYEEALAISREVGDRAGEGGILNNIAGVYDSQGRYEAALATYEVALAIRREVGDRAGEGATLNGIAGVYDLQGQYEAALTTFEEALAIRREVGDRKGEGITLKNIGDVYRDQGQNLEAIRYYEQAEALFDSIRSISGNDVARASFIAQYASVYDRLLDVYVEEDLLMEAFLTSEKGRARSFGDALATGVVQLADNEAAPLIITTNEAYATLLAAQDALARARAFNPPDPELVADLEAQRAAAETAYDESLAALDALDESLEELVPGRLAVSDLAEVQGLLNEQTTLVSFWTLEDRTIAFVVTPNDFKVVTIDVDAATLTTQVLAFMDFVEIESAHPGAAVNLYDTLIAPLQPHLHTPHLIIVPHQILNYLPFAALTNGEKYLMDQFTITYLPSASTLKYLPDVADAPSYETALVLGNPATGNTDEFGEVLSNLPYAAQSAETIAGLFGTTALVGEAATETAVRIQISSANILHLGAHGRYNTVAPMQSLIYLAGDAEGDVDANGHLRVGEVYSLPIDRDKMELVILSACQTNLGDIDREDPLANISAGDELVSLNRAFLFQSPTVISTLWTVDDAATSLLIEQFYNNLLNGNSKADALRLAQQHVRDYKDGEYANPYYWAGFVLSGDGGEIDPDLIHPASASVTNEDMETDMTPTPADATETAVSEPTVSSDTNNEGNSRPALVIGIGAILLLLFIALAINRRKRAEI